MLDDGGRPAEEEWAWNGPDEPIKGQLALFEPPPRSSTFGGASGGVHVDQISLLADDP